MWLFTRPRKKFSLENLKYLYQQLRKNVVVTRKNQTTIVEVLRQIAELMIWGDKHNPSFFDFFCEKNILKLCIEILGQKCEKSVKVQVIQTLSILLQNTHSETAVFYLLSNNYINDLIVHKFDFSDEGLLAYYISFLKTLSLKLNPLTIQFFFNEKAQDFPLYTEAIKFFNHQEQMVRIAVRTLTLNVYKVDYEPCQKFILDRSAVPYFSNLVHYLVDQAHTISKIMEQSTYLNAAKVNEMVANQIDLYYYIQDIFDLGKDFKKDALGDTLMDQLLAQFILPVLIASLLPEDRRRPNRKLLLSPKLALFLLAQVFFVFRHEDFVNAIATCLIDKHPPLLSRWLMHAAPNRPIKSPVPLSQLLYPSQRRSAHKRRSKQVMSAGEGPGQAASSSAAETPSVDGDAKTPSGASTRAAGEKKRRRRPDIPEDENSKARSAVPEIGPVISPVKACPNYDELLPANEARAMLFGMLHHSDEYLLFGAVAVLDALLKNPSVSKELLVSGGACSQQYYRKRRLMKKVFLDDGKTDSDSDVVMGGRDRLSGDSSGPTVQISDFKVLNTKDAINKLLQRRNVDLGDEINTPRSPSSAPPAPPMAPVVDEVVPEETGDAKGRDAKGRDAKGREEGGVHVSEKGATDAKSQSAKEMGGGGDAKAQGDDVSEEASVEPEQKSADGDEMKSPDDGETQSPNGEAKEAKVAKEEKKTAQDEETVSSKENDLDSSKGNDAEEITKESDIVDANGSGDAPSANAASANAGSANAGSAAAEPTEAASAEAASAEAASAEAASAEAASADSKSIEKSSGESQQDTTAKNSTAEDTTAASEPNEVKSTSEDPVQAAEATDAEATDAKDVASESREGNQDRDTASEDVDRSVAETSANGGGVVENAQDDGKGCVESCEERTPTKQSSSEQLNGATAAIDGKSDSKSDSKTHSRSASQTMSKIEYCRDAVSALLDALAAKPPYRLVTVQMIVDLLQELTLDATPNACLLRSDVVRLEQAYRLSARAVAERFAVPADHDAMLQNFETCFKDLSSPLDVEDLLSNVVALLPLAKNAISGVPLKFRRPTGKIESSKKAVQVYLLLWQLRCKLLKLDDSNFAYKRTLEEEKKIRKNQKIPIGSLDAIPCFIKRDKKRERHFVVANSIMLLVVQQDPDTAGSAVVKAAVPLRSQEVKSVNANAIPPNLTIVIRSGPKPHPTAALRSLGVWALTLWFDTVEDCNNAQSHLQTSRDKARARLIKALIEAVSNAATEPIVEEPIVEEPADSKSGEGDDGSDAKQPQS